MGILWSLKPWTVWREDKLQSESSRAGVEIEVEVNDRYRSDHSRAAGCTGQAWDQISWVEVQSWILFEPRATEALICEKAKQIEVVRSDHKKSRWQEFKSRRSKCLQNFLKTYICNINCSLSCKLACVFCIHITWLGVNLCTNWVQIVRNQVKFERNWIAVVTEKN